MKNLLLTMFFADREQTEETMKIIAIIVVAAIFALIAIIAASNKKLKFDTRSIVYGGVCTALSFTLSFIRLPVFLYGGSITLFSMLPLFLYAYTFGVGRGAAAGAVYGVLQYIQDPQFYAVEQVILDYLIAFSAICVACVFKKVFKSKTSSVLCGALLFSLLRLSCHVLAGITFYNLGYIAEMPFFGAEQQFSAFVYSLLYNLFYMIPETILLCGALLALVLNKNFDTLTKMMTGNKFQHTTLSDTKTNEEI